MSRILLKGGRLLDPAARRDFRGDLLVAEGRIAAVFPETEAGRHRPGPAPEPPPDRVLDCTGCLVVPGLVDPHVHLREPPQVGAAPAGPQALPSADAEGEEETIATGAAAAVAGGFTTVCAMPNTRPPIDSAEAVAWYRRRGEEAGGARVLVAGCLTKGRAGREPADLRAMREAGAAAFTDDGSDVADPAVFEACLARAAEVGAPVLCHCEDPTLAAGGVVDAGPVATMLGLPGVPREAEETAVARACEAARRTGCRVHIMHVSTAEAVAHIRRAKAEGGSVTAEVTPHHLTLTAEALLTRDPVFKVSPPLRTGHDIDALLEALRDGTIDCLATDHAPHPAEAKARPLAEAPPGMVGLESALGIYIKTLLDPPVLDLMSLMDRLTVGPARVLGQPAPTLQPGAPADLTVIDPRVRWRVDPARFVSRGRNCPFAGWEVRGRVVWTLVAGRMAFEAEPT